jgi:hypothetical protein
MTAMVAPFVAASVDPFVNHVQRHGTNAGFNAEKIVRPQKFDRAASWAKVREGAKGLIEVAFEAGTQSAMLNRAAYAMQVSTANVWRIYKGQTETPDLMALCVAMHHYQAKTGKMHPIAAHMVRLIQGGAA